MKRLVWAALLASACNNAPETPEVPIDLPRDRWHFTIESDKMTDEAWTKAMVKSRNGYMFTLDCYEGEVVPLFWASDTRVWFAPPSSPEKRELSYRADGGAIKTANVYISGESVLFYENTDPLVRTDQQFLADLPAMKELVVRVQDYEDSDVTMEFNVAGAEEALERVKANCKLAPAA